MAVTALHADNMLPMPIRSDEVVEVRSSDISWVLRRAAYIVHEAGTYSEIIEEGRVVPAFRVDHIGLRIVRTYPYPRDIKCFMEAVPLLARRANWVSRHCWERLADHPGVRLAEIAVRYGKYAKDYGFYQDAARNLSDFVAGDGSAVTTFAFFDRRFSTFMYGGSCWVDGCDPSIGLAGVRVGPVRVV